VTKGQSTRSRLRDHRPVSSSLLRSVNFKTIKTNFFQEEIDIDLNDPATEDAALKIQVTILSFENRENELFRQPFEEIL
jgi:hypothetical protein